MKHGIEGSEERFGIWIAVSEMIFFTHMDSVGFGAIYTFKAQADRCGKEMAGIRRKNLNLEQA